MTLRDWNTIEYGLRNDFISSEDVMKNIDDKLIESLGSEQIEIIYSNEFNKFDFLNFIESLTFLRDKDNGREYWELYYLNKLVVGNSSKEFKLKQVAIFWAKLGYPENWRSFIHYLPPKSGTEPIGIDGLYENLLQYVEKLTNTIY